MHNSNKSETAHTPGPWTAIRELGIWYINAGKVAIGHAFSVEDGKNNETKIQETAANARLIAAAPEQNKALEGMLRVMLNLRADHEGAWHKDEISAVDEAVTAARRVLKLATGGGK